MSEYTPTTEEINDLCLLGAIHAADGIENLDVPETAAMIDRWLTARDAEIRTAALEEAAGIAENRRPEIGPNVLETPYRSGLYYGGTRTAEAIRAAKDGAQ